MWPFKKTPSRKEATRTDFAAYRTTGTSFDPSKRNSDGWLKKVAALAAIVSAVVTTIAWAMGVISPVKTIIQFIGGPETIHVSCNTTIHDCGSTFNLLDLSTITRPTSLDNALRAFQQYQNRLGKGNKLRILSIVDDLENPLTGTQNVFVHPGKVTVTRQLTENKDVMQQELGRYIRETENAFKYNMSPMGANNSPLGLAISDIVKLSKIENAANPTIIIFSDFLEHVPEYSAYIDRHGGSFEKRNKGLKEHLSRILGNDLAGFTIRLRVIVRKKASQDKSLIEAWVTALEAAGATVLDQDLKI